MGSTLVILVWRLDLVIVVEVRLMFNLPRCVHFRELLRKIPKKLRHCSCIVHEDLKCACEGWHHVCFFVKVEACVVEQVGDLVSVTAEPDEFVSVRLTDLIILPQI